MIRVFILEHLTLEMHTVCNALFFFLINQLFHDQFWVTLLRSDLYHVNHYDKCVAMNNKAGVIGGVSAMLIITLSIPTERQFVCICTAFETFMGGAFIMLVNSDKSIGENF